MLKIDNDAVQICLKCEFVNRPTKGKSGRVTCGHPQGNNAHVGTFCPVDKFVSLTIAGEAPASPEEKSATIASQTTQKPTPLVATPKGKGCGCSRAEKVRK